MEIVSYIKLVSSNYEVEIDLAPDGLTPVEEAAITNFGEPVIPTGGTFTRASPALTFTLPESDRKFPSQFPVKASFDIADNADANARAVLFRDKILERLTTHVRAVRTLAAGTTGKDITNINTTP
jgi:hypothetical protein